MKKFIFILGGARSGKSRYAVTLAKKMKKRTVFIATAAASDAEMKERIRSHRASRPRGWKTVEEPRDIASALRKLDGKYGAALIDCLGLWISGLLLDDMKNKEIERRIKELIELVSGTGIPTVIVVSNDVGSGIVPVGSLSRRFRDLVGLTNQMAAGKADEVIFMQAGIPVRIK